MVSYANPITKIEGFFDDHIKADASVSVKNSMSYNLSTPAFDDQLLFNALSPGRHTIKIVATDSSGGKKSSTRVFYTETQPCEPAIVTTEDDFGGKRVTISCPGANISYSTSFDTYGSGNGSVSVFISDTTKFTITTSKPGRSDRVITETIHVDWVMPPQFSAVEWYGGTKITITSTPGAWIYYRFEGTPYGEYHETFNETRDITVYAYAVKEGMHDSVETSFQIHAVRPNTPVVQRLNTESNVAVGKAASFRWNTDSNAKEFVVYVYKDGSLIRTETQKSNVYSMVLDSAGKYEIAVKAKNTTSESSVSEKVSVNAMAPCTVTFCDDDGSVLAAYTVAYGECVGRQNNPSHKGHYFSGWYPSNNYYEIPVTQNVTYTATYTPIEYEVIFYDVNGVKFGDTQRIQYQHSATLPDYSAYVPGGYVFAGWTLIEASDKESMCDYTHVDADLKLQAVIRWENDEFPIYASVSSASVASEGNGSVYNIVIDASNWPTSASDVYFIAALKTQDTSVSVYKTVFADRVSVSFAAGEIKTVTIPLHYDGIAKRVEVFALERKADDTTGSAYSMVASSSIVFSTTWTDWSDWSTTAPQAISGRDIDSKTQYSYQTKETTTSSSSTMSGWTLYDSSWKWGAWGSWSSWSTTAQTSNDSTQVETKTQYRYRNKEYTSSTSSSLSGWTRVGSHVVYGSWGSNQYTTTKPTESATLQIISSSITGYNYYHYCCNYYDGCWNVDSIPYGNTNSTHYHTIRTTSALPTCSIGDMGGHQAYGGSGSGAPKCSSNFYVWFFDSYEYTYVYQTRTATTYYDYERWGDWSSWSDSSVTATTDRQVETRTVYRYRTRSQEWTYYFYRWTDWSPWSDTPVEANDNRNVRTQTVYRYRDAVPVYDTSAGSEDVSGNVYHFEGSINSDQDLTGMIATIMVYQSNNMDPNQYQLKYIGQTTILSDNAYSISFIPSNEPTMESGNYVVSLGVQGATGLINVDVIEAPKPTYTVRFLLDDGTVISTQTVEEGGNAVVPESPEKQGYRFIGWSDRSTDIYRNIDITAHFEKIRYMVAFVDWANQDVSFQMYYYGDTIEAPYTPEAEGRTFVGWDAILNDDATVTDNMVVSAVYDAATYTVRFMDGNGNAISVQEIEYGEAAVLPDGVEAEGKVFLGWSTDVMWWHVTSDMDVEPILAYEETTVAPIANSDSCIIGMAADIELVSEEGAVIYYTTDGTTPTTESAVYDGAIHLEETTIVSAMAVVEGKNESEVINVFFVYDDTPEPEWLGTVVPLDSKTVEVEAELDVPIEVEINGNPGLIGYSLILECDSSVFYIDCEEDGVICIPGDASTTGTFYVSPYGETGWKITWIGDEPIADDGVLFTIPLKVGEEAVIGTYQIDLGYLEGQVFTEESDDVEMNVAMVHFVSSVVTEQHTVTFLDWDGTVLSEQTVEYGQAAVAPDDPTREGYTFVGWDRDFNNVTEDISVCAMYSALEDPNVLTGVCGDNVVWTLDTTTWKLVISGSGDMYDYYRTTTPWYDYREEITEVEILQGVTRVGPGAFASCRYLVSVSLPDSITFIGGNAFAGCTSIESIYIPSSVNNIAYTAFLQCWSLQSIIVSPDNDYLCSNDGILFNKSGSTIQCYPAGKPGETYSVPNSVTYIAGYAFYSCRYLSAITVPSSCTTVGSYAFAQNSFLLSIELPDTVQIIGSNAFEGCSGLSSVVIPESVSAVNSSTFRYCTSLQSIVLPDSISEIGETAFNGCVTLESITIPANVSTIGRRAFLHCDSLTSVIFLGEKPSTDSSDGGNMFGFCPTELKICYFEQYSDSWAPNGETMWHNRPICVNEESGEPTPTLTPEPTIEPTPTAEPTVEPTVEPTTEPTDPPEDAVVFSATEAYAAPGSDVSVDFGLEGEYEASAFTIYISYDPERLSLNGLTKGAVWLDMLENDATVMTNTNIAGSIRIMAIVPSDTVSTTGTIFTMNFHVSEEVEIGTDIPIMIEVQEFFVSPVGQGDIPIPYTVTNGAIHVSRMPGDVNGDGELNASDVILVMRYALGIIDLEPIQLVAADYTGDGLINASDALAIMRKVLGVT